MIRAIVVAIALALIGAGMGTVSGQAGGGGGGGGGGTFGDCVACKNIVFGLWHCDGAGENMVAAVYFHPCGDIWPGSCLSEHPDPCGDFLAATAFELEKWSSNLLAGATKVGVCPHAYLAKRVA